MLKAAIIGASGYTGVELSRLLCNHPHIEVTAATSRQYDGIPLAEVFPNLRGLTSLICENLSIEQLCERADVFFTAVPHKTAMDLVPKLMAKGKKVVDLSADYRLRDANTYEQWYQEHSSKDYIAKAVYGLPELYREKIAKADLIANPGCYPTSIILAMAPLLKNKLVDPTSIIADSKSGTSGAGRGAKVGALFCEVSDGFKAYGVGRKHRHTPEIEQELSILAGEEFKITFTPHLLPISRGILSTVYANLKEGIKEEDIQKLYEKTYANEKFVRVLPPGELPATQYVRGSNFCDIGFAIDHEADRIIMVSAIDNVVKGAAGQAIQNMNIMCGFEEGTGLEVVPFFP
ncbi:MAG: N-acetyl-gamma-glutamyl-phosphate reductase [Desulfotalea sp.]